MKQFFGWFRSLSVEVQELLVGLVILIPLIIWLVVHRPVTPPVVTHPAPGSTTVQVPASTLTPTIITKIVEIEDKAAANKLLAENAALKAKVTQLTQTVATLTQTGGGIVKTVAVETISEPLRPTPNAPLASTVFEFKDWHLHFVQDGVNAKYELTQKFLVYTTIGRDKNGTPIGRSALYESGAPSPEPGRLNLIPATIIDTVLVTADETAPHWIVSPALQAGLSVIGDPLGTWKGAVLSVQWIKHGRTKAAEDSTWAILSPAVFLSTGHQEFGVLPVSINIGRLKYNPLNDIWISPILTGTPAQLLHHVGIVIGSTF